MKTVSKTKVDIQYVNNYRRQSMTCHMWNTFRKNSLISNMWNSFKSISNSFEKKSFRCLLVDSFAVFCLKVWVAPTCFIFKIIVISEMEWSIYLSEFINDNLYVPGLLPTTSCPRRYYSQDRISHLYLYHTCYCLWYRETLGINPTIKTKTYYLELIIVTIMLIKYNKYDVYNSTKSFRAWRIKK